MRQQIRLVISPAQIAAVINDLEKSISKSPATTAFLNYLKQKQFSLTLGAVAVAYTTKGSKDNMEIASPNVVNNDNAMAHCQMIQQGNAALTDFNDADQKELLAFASIFGMVITP